MLKTLADLRTEARQRANMEDDGNFVSDSEWKSYIQQGVASLYDILIDADDSKYLAKNAPVLTKVGQFAFELPQDFYRLISVDYFASGSYCRATEAKVEEYATLAARQPPISAPEYYIRGQFGTGAKHLFIFPDSVDGANLAIVYIPTPPILDADTDDFDAISDWHEYIIVYAAILALTKEESDTSPLEVQLNRLTKRLRNAMKDINVGEPKTVRDLNAKRNRRRRFLR